jgi:hypothetical protein
MKEIRRSIRRRSPLVLIALLFVTAAIFMATLPKVEAMAGPYICTYYKDASMKKAIGGTSLDCCGQTYSWGQTSLYFKCQTVLCPDVICPF